jgi:predicted nucleotidyltransferase component of viral defense system
VSAKSVSLKAKIRNMAGEKKISPQVLLQNYMFERFLERLSISEYRDKFVIKGGMLIAAMVGVETRSTMDLDVSVRAYPLNVGNIETAIEKICSMDVVDGVFFRLERVGQIRRDDEYGGIRASLEAVYDSIITHLSVDITSGDVITPSAVRYGFKTLFDEGKEIALWSYNVETILAEKVETILRRSTFNSRSRDFYDVYILVKTQTFSLDAFQQALKATSEHRATADRIRDVGSILKEIENSDELKSLWVKYQKDYSYAQEVTYEDTVSALRDLLPFS